MRQKQLSRLFPLLFLTILCLTGYQAMAQVNDLNTLSSSPPPDQSTRQDPWLNEWKEEVPQGTPGLFRNRFFTGGGLGLQFGTLTAVELAPTVGFIVHRMFRFGITVNFSYYRDAYFRPALSSYYWGGSFFIRFYPIRRLFLHVEIGGMNQPYGIEHDRKWLAYPLAGIGYSQPLGNRVALTIKALWNFNNDEYSIYGNPLISIGCDVGL